MSWNEDRLQFDQNEYTLDEVADNFVLPQVVKVLCGYEEGNGTTIESQQILTIHKLRFNKIVKATNSRGQDVFIPSSCKQQVELRPNEWLNELSTVKELSMVFPKYRFARVTQGVYATTKQRALNIGDKLELEQIKRAEDVLICHNQDEVRLCLPLNSEAGFHVLYDGGEYLLDDLISARKLPLNVQFIDHQFKLMENSNIYNPLLGVLKLETLIVKKEFICSSKPNDKRFVLIIPEETNIPVVAADDQVEQNKKYLRLCKALDVDAHLAEVEELEPQMIYLPPERIREYKRLEFNAGVEERVEESPPPLPPRSPTRPRRKNKSKPNVSHQELSTSPTKSETSYFKGSAKTTSDTFSDFPSETNKRNCDENKYTSTSDKITTLATNFFKSKSDLSDLTISEVSDFLRVHHLEALVESFEQEQIDGNMLLVLEHEEMKALGLNLFQVKKLMMLIEGWRPKQ